VGWWRISIHKAHYHKQNLVFREDPKADAPKLAPPKPPEGAEVSREITPDPVTMFRYSALTFNGHRIHYDVDYARDVEGYEGLVFHAPLTATLLMELASEIAGKAISTFKYRATAPLFGHEKFSIHGKKENDKVTVWAQTPSGGQAMIGEAMTDMVRPRVKYVIGPDGSPLTVSDLPPTSTRRWVIRRKAEVVAAVRGGLLSLEEACDRYTLTVEEFLNWQSSIDEHGLAGLRTTRIQEYRA